MNIDWRPWRQMLPIWLPAVIVALILAGWFFYQTSDSVGRKATLASDIAEFGAEVERLEMLHELVVADRREVE
jgi:paraquat-inducible protein B